MARNTHSAEDVGASEAERAWLAKLDASITHTKQRSHRVRATAPTPIELGAVAHPAGLEVAVLLRACTARKGRSSGPGGQNRNKVETLVELTHGPTGVTAHAGERRTASENQRVAVARLRRALAILVRCEVSSGDCRSELWKQRCSANPKHAGRIVVSPAHEDFPAMLALALDVIWAAHLDVKTAALRLCCTASQLTKLVKDDGHAFAWLNAHRAAAGLHLLK